MPRVRKRRLLKGSTLFLLGLVAGFGISARSSALKTPSIKTILENSKVLVTEVVFEKAAQRPTHTRPNDQVIVFLNDAQYEVVYPDGRKESKTRKAGETIWHNRGDIAPTLTNTGSNSYRTIVINLK